MPSKKSSARPKYPYVEILDSDRCRWKIQAKYQGRRIWLTSNGTVHPWELWPGVPLEEGVRRLAAAMSSEAMRARSHYEAHGELPPAQVARRAPKLGELAREWITTVVPATCRPVSVQDYTYMLDKHILPTLADKPITSINKADVRLFLMGKLNEGLSASTVRHIQNALSGIFTLAVDAQHIQVNPAQRLGRMGKPSPPKESRPLTVEELAALLRHFERRQPAFYPLVFTLARTGMRVGEALALKWTDIDWQAMTARVARTRSRGVEIGQETLTKTGKVRVVDLTPQVVEVLRGVRTANKEAVLRAGLGEVPPQVFLDTREKLDKPGQPRNLGFGQPMTAKCVRGAWGLALKAVGLSGQHVHDLRHTYVCHSLDKQIDPRYVADQIGDTFQTFFKHYVHWIPSDRPRAVEALDRVEM